MIIDQKQKHHCKYDIPYIYIFDDYTFLGAFFEEFARDSGSMREFNNAKTKS